MSPHSGDLGPGAVAPVNATAVAAVVVAVGNVVFGSFLGLFLPALPAVIAVVAVVLGHVALAQLRRSGTGESGRGLAITALVVGYVWLALSSLLVGGMLLFTGFGLAVLGF
ncbi:MAG TPA: DUF4190 domain-containing protein [Actinomycetales bacterium]|nr:DUF4190 domain-containing protein [Actinomycetales bacterium]